MSLRQWLNPRQFHQGSRSKIQGKQLASTSLLTVGATLVMFVAGSYAGMFHQQHALMRRWKIQNQLAHAITTNDVGLTRLTIPRIDLDVVIAEGTSARSLALGPGHLTNTAIPGDTGNAVIAAHRDTYFRHIAELRVGEDIYIQRNGRKYRYVVTGRKIVSPEDVSVLESSPESRLTLITCYPVHYIGPAPRRLIVFAKQMQTI